MHGRRHTRIGFVWLELLLILAATILLLQLWPSLGRGIWQVLDIRTWSSRTWMILNAVVLLGLIGSRFIPQIYLDWRQRQEQSEYNRQRQEEVGGRKKRRESIERAKSARRRYH